MSVEIGYRPERIEALDWHTRHSIDDLSSLRSSDPAAAGALRAIRLTRRNLDDHWLGLITAIKASDAMISWTTSMLHHLVGFVERLDEWLTLTDKAVTPSRFALMSDDELLAETLVAGHLNTRGDGAGSIADRHARGDPFWFDEFPDLASAIATRVATDEEFAARLVDEIGQHPLAAVAIAHADFPASFSAAVLPVLVQKAQWWSGVHVEAIENAMSHVMGSSPAAVLDMLGDRSVLTALVGATTLDDTIARAFVRSGLYDAVQLDPDRLDDGYAVLQELTVLADDDFDDGFHAGVAQGIADSMFGYVATLTHGIDFTKGAVYIHLDEGDSVGILGSRDSVSNLFGTIMRDPIAQATMGVVMGAYSANVVAQLGTDLATRTGVEDVARFGILLRDGLDDEQNEEILAVAAESARRQNIGKMIGFGAGAWLSATGAGLAWHTAVDIAIAEATDPARHRGPDDIIDVSFGATAYAGLLVSWLEFAINNPDRRYQAGLDDVSAGEWNDVEQRLRAINELHDGPGRRRELHDLRNFIEQVPALDAAWTLIEDKPTVDELLNGAA